MSDSTAKRCRLVTLLHITPYSDGELIGVDFYSTRVAWKSTIRPSACAPRWNEG